MNRLDKIRAQHAEHDMSDSDEFYLLGLVTELEGVVDYLVANGPKTWAPQNIQREIDASIRRCSQASGVEP